jgi:nucleotide-binding universal stress UspA family protein
VNAGQTQILVPIDGSEYSTRALDVAVDLARALGAELVIFHVVDLSRVAMLSAGQAELIPVCLQELETEGRQIADDALHRVAPGVQAMTRIADGMPLDQIGRIAAEIRPGFIVMGSHGRSGVNRALMGSVAEGVARRSPVPVMIVPPSNV